MEMTPDKWERIKVLFDAALERMPEQRIQYLTESCADEDLRAEVARLLINSDCAESFLEVPAFSDLHLFTARTASGSFALGERLAGRFMLVRFLAEGGMGEVYEAEDQVAQERVAVKMIRPELLRDSRTLQRFRREVHVAKKVTHPNVCRIFDLFHHHDVALEKDLATDVVFLSMELLLGETLAQRIHRAGCFTTKEALPLIRQIADGLGAAHRAGVVHRDFKPSNVVLVEERDSACFRAVITDFGLALRLGGDANLSADLTTARGAFGTPAYMAPEQIQGHAVTSAADIYSLGLVIHEMVTGVLPFGSETPLAMAVRRVHEPAPSPRLLMPSLDSAWESAILRCLEREPDQRFQTTDAVVRAFDGETQFSVRSPAAISETTTLRWGTVVGTTSLIIGLTVGGWLLFSRRTPPLTSKDTIVLADFMNRTGDTVFDGTLRQGLSVQLEQSPFLSLISDQQIQQTLALMGRSTDSKLTPEIAREICQRTGSAAALEGSIAQIGTQYLLTLKTVNCKSGESLASAEAEAIDKNHVLDALGKTASEIRNKLGESLNTVRKLDTPLEQATTPSLGALQAYSLGEDAHRKGDFAASIPFFQQAVELDPNFAMAYAMLGTNYANTGETTKSEAYTLKAFELRGRVSEKERFYIASNYYGDVIGNLEKAIPTYQLWAKTYPRESKAVCGLAYTYFKVGRYDDALLAAQTCVNLEPSGLSYDTLMAGYFLLNRFDEAKATAAEAQLHHFDSSLSHLNLYLIAFIEHDVARMAREAAAVRDAPGHEYTMLTYEALTAAYLGERAKARDFSRRAADFAQRAGDRQTAAARLADAAFQEALMGDAAEGRRGASTALAMSKDSDVMATAALAYAFAGETAEADVLANDCAKRSPEDTLVQSVLLPTVRAMIALNRGNAANAIEILQTASPYELSSAGQMYPVYARGEAYLAAGDGRAAAAEFQKVLDHRGIVPNTPIGAIARLGLARGYLLQGDTKKGKAAYQDFLALWKNADADIPILTQAKTEIANLQ